MGQILTESIDNLRTEFIEVRKKTLDLFKPLKIEDAVMQSNVFGSPPNWHLAHTTWFFQKVLEKHGKKMDFEKQINTEYLNSYYQKFQSILPKPERGRFPRPVVKETLNYRSLMEKEVLSLLNNAESYDDQLEGFKFDIMLANQHEMQHQELMVYDLQHYFQRYSDAEDNYIPITLKNPPRGTEMPGGMVEIAGGIYELGFNGETFCYDNELPEHKVYLQSFKMDVTPVTNQEFMKFIDDGGYEKFKYWLADGWDLVKDQGWKAPLYWEHKEGVWVKKDFHGYNHIDPDQPVTNVSYYEADAFARWAGKRIPSEAEWEKAASWNEELQKKMLYPWGNEKPSITNANLLESYIWAPTRIGSYPRGVSFYGCHQMIGDIWEWTSSEYKLFSGFRSRFEEYTDKWAINQKVLRGGSFATPVNQIRNSYRNYFKPFERILFAGFRCAKDI